MACLPARNPMRGTLCCWQIKLLVLTAVLISAGTVGAADQIPFGATWDWLHDADDSGLANPNDTDPDFESTWYLGTGDFAAQYDGPAFSTGPALLGYGTIDYGPIATDIGTPPSGSRGTAYFRHEFTNDGALTDVYGLELLSDDGAVVYLDGLELVRNNFSGVDAFEAFADGNGNEGGTSTFSIDPITAGQHVLAASLHQTNATSSDLGIDARLFSELPPPPGSRILTIMAEPDDAEEHLNDGSMDLTSSDLELGNEDSSGDDPQLVGLRYVSVDIPVGATINSASIQFTVDEDDKTADPASFGIFGELSPNVAEFTDEAGNLSGRDSTSTVVEWLDVPSWTGQIGEAGANQLTPDLSAIVQEIVDQPGWAAGNALAISIGALSDEFSGANRTAEAFDGPAPVLTVNFTPIPEPSSALLAVLGIVGLWMGRIRRR